jgi:hypothetical protein
LTPKQPDPRRPSRFGTRSLLGTLATASLFYPLLLCLALYGEWLAAYNTLGRAPVPMADDPKSIVEIRGLHIVTGVLMMGYLPAAFGAITLAVVDWVVSRNRFLLALRFGTVLVAWLMVIVLLRWDPGRVAEWWID